MRQYLSNYERFQPLLYELVARDVKIKYRKSAMGVLWTLLNPLMMMVILSVVFSNLFRFDIENYSLYLLAGQIIFNFYNESTSGAMTAILGNASLIKKVYIPKYLFVVSRITSSGINILSSFCALILVMVFTKSELHWTMFLAVIPLAYLFVFSLGIGLILAALTVRFRDVMHLYSVFVTALMYLTPVIYSISMLPKWVQFIVKLNPLTGILTIFRNVVIYNTIPSIQSFLVSGVTVIVTLGAGMWIFYKQQDSFILNL
ncbi:ABC transporter permease [Faecalicatena contorta]|uniref:Transport permease protein n=1 Tax=Faecalicatena contorta TaxID=39482 RepID=A0A315ZS48_9FIRM|nr:ABC transporter permease [Faecalicatena contorta]PWJ48376.1 ABC-2 type transport system permease protein [Faecalicatena contorta]SUQ15399.1 ABC-2 type transport system permease protein [Faecalicatena contorta]